MQQSIQEMSLTQLDALRNYAEQCDTHEFQDLESSITKTHDGTCFIHFNKISRRGFLKSIGIFGFSSSIYFLTPSRAEAFLGFMMRMGIQKAAAGPLYSDDVFSTYLYTGNGSTQTITNGIDLASKGGMVWCKLRSGGYSASLNHCLSDSVTGVTKSFSTNNSGVSADYGSGSGARITSFNSNGFSMGSNQNINESGDLGVSWTFRRASKFFDIVSWTGTGTSVTVSHSLECVPGMIIIKACDADTLTNDWLVWSNGMNGGGSWVNSPNGGNWPCADALNSTSGFGVYNGWLTNVSATSFLPTYHKTSGVKYVAYLFGHDTSSTGLIKCGSFTTDASGNANINLGWEPQWMLWKNNEAGQNWLMTDHMRGWTSNVSGDSLIYANTSGGEVSAGFGSPTSTGVGDLVGGQWFGGNANKTYYYMAIRRPNKPPKTGTQVYQNLVRTGTGVAATVDANFPVDTILHLWRSSGNHTFFDRLRGNRKTLTTNETGAENSTYSDTDPQVDLIGQGLQTRITYPSMDWNNGSTTINLHFFKRAPGFFDVLCYTGNGDKDTASISHGLTVTPDLVIMKCRSHASEGTLSAEWWVAVNNGSGTAFSLKLNSNAGKVFSAPISDLANSTNINPYRVGWTLSGLGVSGNTPGQTYIAYLFATCPGVSKVASYTGNGSSMTINCGFQTTARFILIKRTDSTGDWYVWDSAKGITNLANDPHISLNSSAAEVTNDDSVDSDSSGFIVKQNTATNINVLSATYIYLAIS